METLYDEKVNGIITRARARWHEHGEKNSKYFFNPEKRNHIRKHIRKLHVSGVIITDPFKIGEEQADYYKKLYKSRETDLNDPESKQFFKDTNIPKLSNDMRNLCEREIKMRECENVLHSFATGKTSGNDGLPIEFYKTFWPTEGKILVQVFNEAYNAKEMSNSQKQAVITLIEKKDNDRTFLENWRPISFINVDSKIASQVITMRIIKVLPEIIRCSQTGYVQNRFIGEAVRSIIDIMDHTKNTNIAGMLLFIDSKRPLIA